MNARSVSLGFALACALSLVVAGCASSKQIEWKGDRVMEGEGGVAETVEGIDFYRNGAPKGKFEVLGVLETHHYTGGNLVWNSMAAGDSKGKAIKEAKRLGGTAIVPYDMRQSTFGGGTTTTAGTVYANPTGGPSVHTSTSTTSPTKASVHTVFLVVRPCQP